MTRIKKIKVFPFAVFQAAMLSLVGLFAGILYSFGGLFIDVLVSAKVLSAASMSTPGLSYGTILAFGALIGMPLIFAVVGFLTGLAEAILFNLFSTWFGGLDMDFEK